MVASPTMAWHISSSKPYPSSPPCKRRCPTPPHPLTFAHNLPTHVCNPTLPPPPHHQIGSLFFMVGSFVMLLPVLPATCEVNKGLQYVFNLLPPYALGADLVKVSLLMHRLSHGPLPQACNWSRHH